MACCTSGEGEGVVSIIDPGAESAYSPVPSAQQATQAKVTKEPQKPGKPCTGRMPKAGDLVMCLGGKKVGHDNDGVPKAWVLNPSQSAEVVEVDDDGDFRLRNDAGVESGFLFRSEFVYVQGAEEEKQETAVPEQKKRPSLVDKSGGAPVEIENSGSHEGSPVKEPVKEEKKLDEPLAGAWFEVVLEKVKATDKFGLHLDTIDEKAFEVIGLVDGLVKTYNLTASEDKKVVPGHLVMGINGKSGDKTAMLNELHLQSIVKLVVAPRTTFAVQLAKPESGSLGMNLTYEDKCKSILFLGCLPDSAVDVYNKTAPSGEQVVAGDRILEVNGVTGQPQKMLEAMKDATQLSLKVARPVR